jgi:hypothetical protein
MYNVLTKKPIIFVFLFLALIAVAVLTMPKKYVSPDSPRFQKEQMIKIKVSGAKAQITKVMRLSDGDSYCVRYSTNTGEILTTWFSEYELEVE